MAVVDYSSCCNLLPRPPERLVWIARLSVGGGGGGGCVVLMADTRPCDAWCLIDRGGYTEQTAAFPV